MFWLGLGIGVVLGIVIAIYGFFWLFQNGDWGPRF